MTVKVEADGIEFEFPTGWTVSRYDGWSFYRNQLCRFCGGLKAVDLLALGTDDSVWLVEVKDYRAHPRTKPSELPEEVAQKALDTLAALLPASLNALDAGERSFARDALGGGPNKRLRVALHLEQPRRHSRLFPRVAEPADLKDKLKRRLKPVDPHPVVVENRSHRQVPWTTQALPSRQRRPSRGASRP